MNENIDHIIYDELESERIDKYLASYYDDISRSTIQSMIKNGDILVNNKAVKANYLLELDDDIEIIFRKEKAFELEKEDIKLDIKYEDDDIIVVNKPSGMVVHPAVGNKSGTLVNALLYHCNSLSNDDIRPGIVHRIDKDTSGLLVVCKNDYSHQKLSEQFQDHLIKKIYYAIVSGVIPHNLGKIDAPIGRDLKDRQKMAINEIGKNAITHFKVLERFKNHTLVELKLETGRTHQIRVHMQYIGYPVTGDPLYGYKKEIEASGQFLHAKVLGFYHPRTNEWMEFESDLPDYFNEYLNKLKNEMNE